MGTREQIDSFYRFATEYLYKGSPQGAAAWLDAYRQARMRLASDADRCSQAEEAEHFDIDVKQVLFKSRRGRIYRMLFTIVGNEVRILRVRGPGQAPATPSRLTPYIVWPGATTWSWSRLESTTARAGSLW